MVTLLIFLAAIALLVWGFVRARPYGKIGVFAWLQSVVLMLPWLLFFGLFTLGVYFNLAGVLFLVLTSAGVYIYLGRRLRAMGQDELAAQKLKNFMAVSAAEGAEKDSQDIVQRVATQSADGSDASSTPPAQDKPSEVESVPTMPAVDQTALEGIFGIDTFFRTETVPYD